MQWNTIKRFVGTKNTNIYTFVNDVAWYDKMLGEREKKKPLKENLSNLLLPIFDPIKKIKKKKKKKGLIW